MTVKENMNDEVDELTSDESMTDAFDFDIPEGDPDDLSDISDDKDSADETGDDKDSAGDDEDGSEGEEDVQAVDSIDPKLFVRIGRMGLSDEDTDRVLGLGSNKAITTMLDMLSDHKGKSADGISEDDKAEWFEFGEEAENEFAPELTDVLKSMNSSTKKAVEHLLSRYEKRIDAMNQTIAGRDENAFDDAVESLGKDWKPVFGNGDDVDGKSEHGRNLERLRKAVLSDQYKGSIAKRVKNAVNDMFAEHSNKLAKDVTITKARNRQGRMIGRPAQRKMTQADMTPRQRAVANVSRQMKEKNIHPDQNDTFDPYADI